MLWHLKQSPFIVYTLTRIYKPYVHRACILNFHHVVNTSYTSTLMVKDHFALLLGNLLLLQDRISTMFMKMENCVWPFILPAIRLAWDFIKQAQQLGFLRAHPRKSRAQSNDPADSLSISMTSFFTETESVQCGWQRENLGSGTLPWDECMALSVAPTQCQPEQPLAPISGTQSCRWSFWCFLTPQEACACPLACLISPGGQLAFYIHLQSYTWVYHLLSRRWFSFGHTGSRQENILFLTPFY